MTTFANTSTSTRKAVGFEHLRWDNLLSSMKYSKDGGLNTPHNAMHDDYFFVPDEEITWTAPEPDKSYGLEYDEKGIAHPVMTEGHKVGDGKIHTGKNALEWLCYSVAKKWRQSRDYLPKVVHTPQEYEVQETEVCETLFECFKNGEARDGYIIKCFKALDEFYRPHKQDTHKTAPRIEHEWKAQRAFVATLFTGDLTTVGGKPEDINPESEYGGFSLEEREQMDRLVALFNAVKEGHNFASREKWLCAQCYALNMPHEQGINTVYGVDIAKAKTEKSRQKAFHSARVKYSRHANEVFGWILNEVENQPSGIDKWVSVLNRCKATAQASDTLEECVRAYGLNNEVVKTLRSYLDTMPDKVLAYCEAIRKMAAKN